MGGVYLSRKIFRKSRVFFLKKPSFFLAVYGGSGKVFTSLRMAGYLFACPNVPESFHADMIEDCVEV